MYPNFPRHGMTLVEMLFIMLLSGITMVLIYTVFGQTAIRAHAGTARADGQQTVRILLARIRQELKSAIGLVDIGNNGKRMTIPLEDKRFEPDDPARYFFSEYEYNPDGHEIIYRKLNRDRGGPLEQRLWLGGKTQVRNFYARATSENERILFQYYRVLIEIATVDIKMRTKGPDKEEPAGTADGDRTKEEDVIHSTTTVYPRRVNMELRIEVPQEGGSI